MEGTHGRKPLTHCSGLATGNKSNCCYLECLLCPQAKVRYLFKNYYRGNGKYIIEALQRNNPVILSILAWFHLQETRNREVRLIKKLGSRDVRVTKSHSIIIQALD